jgi:hypothetical protein
MFDKISSKINKLKKPHKIKNIKNISNNEFIKNRFRTVNLEGEVISYTNNDTVLHIDSVYGIDFEALSKLKKEINCQVSIFPVNDMRFGIEIRSTENTYEKSCQRIYKTVEAISSSIPFVKEELGDILLGLTKEHAVRTKNMVLLPVDSIHVQGYDNKDYVFYRKGWLNNQPSTYEHVINLRRECNALNQRINRKDEKGNSINVFDPFKDGYPSFFIEGMIHEALLLGDRAKARNQEALDESSVESIESLCCSYEDLERGILILDDLVESETYDIKDFDTSIFIREKTSEYILNQIIVLKDLIRHFPSYEMIECKILGFIEELEEIYAQTNELLIDYEDLRNYTIEEIVQKYDLESGDNSDEHTLEDKGIDKFKCKLISEYSDLYEKGHNENSENFLEELENPILDYVLEAKNHLHDFRITVTYLRDLPHDEQIENPPTNETVEDLEVDERLFRYEGIIEYCYSELSEMKQGYQQNNFFSPFIHLRSFSRMKKLEDEINHFEPLYNKLKSLCDYCNEKDILCFDNNMPIKILEEARQYALELVNNEETLN